MHKKCACLELFWFVFSRIRTEYVKIEIISLHSVQMLENADQNGSEHGHFSRSVILPKSNAVSLGTDVSGIF